MPDASCLPTRALEWTLVVPAVPILLNITRRAVAFGRHSGILTRVQVQAGRRRRPGGGVALLPDNALHGSSVRQLTSNIVTLRVLLHHVGGGAAEVQRCFRLLGKAIVSHSQCRPLPRKAPGCELRA